MSRRARTVPALAPGLAPVLMLVLALVAACAGPPADPADTREGALGRLADLRGVAYVVAGGGTTELAVLCQLAVAALDAAGATARDECGKVGAADVRRSAARTDVDTGWSYPGRPERARADVEDAGGTGAVEDADAPWPALARRDAARGVVRLAPTAFSDADALVVAPDPAHPLPRTPADPALRGAVVCATPAAAADPDRLPAVRAAYGLTGPVRLLDDAAVLAGVATGTCGLGEVPGTSGRIPALDLVALDDPRGALTGSPAGRGGVSPVLRAPLFAAAPAVADVLGAVTARLDSHAMRGLNEAVDVQGRSARDAARRWLAGQGLIAEP